MSFENVLGHENIIRALESCLQENKVGHAYLFTGPAGIGKKTLTRSFATALLCQEHTGTLDCPCQSCRLIRAEAHPDLITIAPTGNSIKIEQLREMQRTLFLRPLLGKRKVFIFSETEQLTEAAANSFLKLLEEPPPGIVFLFTAVRPDHILATIRSRCQIFQLFPIGVEQIAAWLVQKGLSVAAARERAEQCQGIPGLALAESGPETAGASAAELMGLEELLQLDLLHMLKLSAEFEKKERQELLAILRHWQAEARNLLLRQGMEGKPARADLLMFVLEQLAEILTMIEANVSPRLAVDRFFMAVRLFAA